jgi:GNAT superfamily N-acetyltransferase
MRFQVHPDHRGKKLGEALLKARFQMCWTLGIKVTKTVFTSPASQKTAFRCNMDVVKEISYNDIRDEHTGELAFPKVPSTNTVHLCVRLLQRATGQRLSFCTP